MAAERRWREEEDQGEAEGVALEPFGAGPRHELELGGKLGWRSRTEEDAAVMAGEAPLARNKTERNFRSGHGGKCPVTSDDAAA